jgi:hypothetical protein
LTADFQDIDRDERTVYAGANYVLSQAAKGGLLGSYSVTDYQQAVQNDGESWTVGPNLTLKLSRWLTASASAGYTVSTYRPNGLIADASGYRGPTYQVGFQHTINQRTSHNLRFGESVGLGFGSNYTKNRLLQYNLQTLLTKAISLNTIFAYEWLEASGGVGDRAERFLLYFGSGYQFTRAWSAGVSYSLALRDSALPGRDYLQNRLTIDLTRRF